MSGATTLTTLTGAELIPVQAGAVTAQVKLSTVVANAQGSGSGATTWSVFGAMAATQPTAAAQAAVTDGSGGTASPTTGVDSTAATQTFLVPVTMASLANSQTFAIDPGFAGKVTGISYRNTAPVTTDSKAATIQANANGSGCTGGAISLVGKYAVGAAQAGTAITAANTFTAAQTIGFAVSSVTAFSEGEGVIELTVANLDLADSLSTVIAQGNAIRSALVTLGVMKGA